MVETGRSGARAALALSEDSGRFLSTVQIGITLVGILTGAFSGAALGGLLVTVLETASLSHGIAEPLGFGLVVVAITYLSIVVGELVPKRFALRAPEAIACLVAPGMTLLSRLATPVDLIDFASPPSYEDGRCRKDQRKAELARPGRPSGNLDGDGFSVRIILFSTATAMATSLF